MAARRAGVITVDFEARTSKLDYETTQAAAKLGRFGAAGLAAGKQISEGAATASTGVKRLGSDIEQTGRTLGSSYVQGALHAAGALTALAAAHALAITALKSYASNAVTSFLTTNQLVNGYRALRIALSPTPFTVAAVAMGIAAEETVKLVNARGKLIEQQAIFATANQIPISSVEALDEAALLSGRKPEHIRSLYQALQSSTGAASPQQLGEIAKQFDAMADPIEKAALATKLFGASAGQALEQLNAGFATATTNVEAYGLSMDNISRQQVVQFHRDLLQIQKDIKDIPSELLLGIDLSGLRAFTEESKLRIVEVAALFDDLAKRGASAVKSWVDSLGIPRVGGMEQRGTIEPPGFDETNARITADALIAGAEAVRLRQRQTLAGQKELFAESERRAKEISQQLADDATKRQAARDAGIQDATLLSEKARLALAVRADSAAAVAAGAGARVKQLEAEAEAAKKAATAEIELQKIRQRVRFTGQLELNRAAEEFYAATKTPQERIHAEMRLEGDRAVARANEELSLARPGARLSAAEEATTRAEAEGKVLLTREAEWRKAIEGTTESLKSRIAAQQLLNDAIGKGYERGKAANVEAELMSRFGQDYTKPGETGPRSVDVEKVRAFMLSDYDAKHTAEINTATQALREQLAIEKAVYDAQAQGAAAIEHIRQAYEAYQLFRKHASAEEIADMIRLNELRKAAEVKGELIGLNLEIASAEALTEAQLQGAEAVRQATLDAKYARMRQENQYGASTENVIATTAALDEAEHQAQILHDALATGMAYRDRLYNLDQEIGKLKDIEAVGKGTLETTLSLKKLEDERLDTMAQQTLAMGRLRDGVDAFFLDMQRQGETTAQIIYKSLESSVDRFSDTLTKAITGQKAGWGHTFTEIGQEMVRSTIRQQAGHALGRLGPWLHTHFPNIPGFPGIPHPTHPTHGTIDASRLPIPGKSAAQILNSWKQDGQTPQSAFWVQIADTGFPAGGASAPPFGFPLPGSPEPSWGAPISYGAPLPGATLARPSTNIVPNRSMNSGGGYHYTIIQDNRGTDPVLTEQRTQQGILAAHNAAVSNAMAAQVEFQKRSPT